MLNLSVQEQVSNRAYSLNDDDAKMFLALMDRVMESYNLPILTPEDRAALDKLEAEDTEPGVPLEKVLAQYGMSAI